MAAPLYLVDASVYVFRAWFSVPSTVIDARGEPANAVYGFGRMLAGLLARERPQRLACAFDASLTRSFRNELYPAYKANRPLPPPDLERQFEICRALAAALGIAVAESHRFEADDLIGTLAARHRAPGTHMVYVTADKDYAQLMQGADEWWDLARERRLGVADIPARLGVAPEHVADLLALAGDSSDNIPGVPGIGPRTAAALLQALGGLEEVYASLARVPTLPLRGARRVRDLLARHREQAFLSRRLARIHCAAPLPGGLADLAWRGVDPAALDALELPVQLRSHLRRLESG